MDNNFKIEILLKQLDKQLNLQKFADWKAYLILGLLAFIAWKIIPMFFTIQQQILNNPKNVFLNVIIVLAILVLFFSYFLTLYYTLKVIFPNTKSLKPNIFYFGYTANIPYDEVAEEFKNLDEISTIEKLSHEYTINSYITTEKFKNVKKSLIYLFLTLITFITFYFIASYLEVHQNS